MGNICSRLLDQLKQQQQQLGPLIPLLKELYEVYNITSREFPIEAERDLACKALAHALVSAAGGEVIRRLVQLLESIIAQHAARGDFEASPDNKTVVSLLLRGFHNFSDCSVDFVRALAASEAFCRGCCLKVLNNWTPLFLQGRLGAEAGQSLRRLIDILYNAYFKLDTETDSHLAAYDFVEPAKPLLRSSDERMSFSALLLVCFALDESKAEFYLGQKESISLLINTLNRSIGSKNRRYLGYHTLELAKCVNRIALNDINKELLVELKLLPVLHRLLDGGKPDEMGAAVNVLFTLSFNQVVRDQVGREFAAKLGKLATESRWSGLDSLQGLLFKLNSPAAGSPPAGQAMGKLTSAKAKKAPVGARGDAAPDAVETASSSAFHVMISYQHESKELVSRIREQLKLNGVKVWIDYEQMTDGSTLSAMADAVENSAIVLMCMSRRYKDSNNCRLEAEYAHRSNKKLIPLLMERGYKPNGWLGLILGAGLYHDFSGKYPFEAKLPELLSAIRKFLELDSVDAAPRPVGQSRQNQATPTGPKPAVSRLEHEMPTPPPPPLPPIVGKLEKSLTDISAWTAVDIDAWLGRRSDGQAMIQWLRGRRLTGVALRVLLDMRKRAPQAFYATVEKHFDFGEFALMAEFINALEEL